MKRTLELVFLLVILLFSALYTAAQVNDQPPQPTSPKNGISPTDEPASKEQSQAITLKVVGANLRDSQGAPIGRVEDMVVDPASGRIDLLIVSAYFPTNSTKLLPIPWKAITYRAEQSGLTGVPGANQVFALNFPRTKLQQAPTFERFRWPNMAEAGWRQPIYEFYSIKERDSIGASGADTQTQSGVGTGVGPNTATGPTVDPSVPNPLNRTNVNSSRTNLPPLIPATPGINRLPSNQSQTNLPAGQAGDLRNQPSTPDNRLPIGKRL